MPSKDVLFTQQQQQQQQNRIIVNVNNNNNVNVNNNNNNDDEMTSQDFIARDMDLLVAEIKENLRLRARPCRGATSKQRTSPYKVPPPSSGKDFRESGRKGRCHSCGSPACCLRTCLKKPHSDPYELLQELLKEGSLIKEAVKRLQTTGGNDDDDDVDDAGGDPPVKRDPKSFYDDLESHSPRPDILV